MAKKKQNPLPPTPSHGREGEVAFATPSPLTGEGRGGGDSRATAWL
jgi:hypothetical protein